MSGEGQMLRSAREKKKISLTQVEESTKIRVRYLEALENEDYAVLPGTPYIKGFLRTYSRYLGLNSDDIIDLYKASLVSEVAPTLEPPLTPMRKKPLWFRPIFATIMAILAIIIVIGIANWSSPEGKQSVSDYTPPPLPSAPSNNPPADSNTPKSAPKPEDVVAATTDGLNAQLVFSQPCWLVVNVDGQPALQGTFGAGVTKEFKATEKIEFVTIGNAGGISIILNGKDLPSLGESGDVVRNYIIDKNTLSNIQ